MKVLGQPMDKTHWTMDKWGYTGSACIPMTLDDAVEKGKVRRGRPGGLLRQRWLAMALSMASAALPLEAA